MSKSQFVFVWCLLATSGISTSIPLQEKDFFWYPTDNGVVPAFIKDVGAPSPSSNSIEEDVIFWHYLPGETEGRTVTVGCDDCTSHFIKGAPLVIMTHGFGSSHTGGFGTNLREGFAKRGKEANLVFVNWSKLAPIPWYNTAVNNVKPVGEYAATLLNFLIEQGIATSDNVFYIGHSLGAHVGNYVSANAAGGKLHRIFALDPALPLFDGKDDSERIDLTDANFVVVFHTAMGILGFVEPRGHVDFYPNSGKSQPGCPPDYMSKCSHSRSYEYMGESIGYSDAFEACKCDSWDDYEDGSCSCEGKIRMGWDTPTDSSGSYYLRTNSESPFGQTPP